MSFCQLAHDLFNYLAAPNETNRFMDLSISHSSEKQSKTSPLCSVFKAPLVPCSRIPLLHLFQSSLSNGLQQLGRRCSVESQVQ